MCFRRRVTCLRYIKLRANLVCLHICVPVYANFTLKMALMILTIFWILSFFNVTKPWGKVL